MAEEFQDTGEPSQVFQTTTFSFPSLKPEGMSGLKSKNFFVSVGHQIQDTSDLWIRIN
jgi:hypothetical protein